MDKNIIMSYLKSIDEALKSNVQLCVIGSVPCVLSDAPIRTTGDIDVWVPESYFENKEDFLKSCVKSNILVIMQSSHYSKSEKPYIQMIDSLSGIVEIGEIDKKQCLLLYKGDKLIVNSVPPANIIASKLVRCETKDISDCVFLIKKFRVSRQQIENVIKTFKNETNSEISMENLIILDVIGIFDNVNNFDDTFLLRKLNNNFLKQKL